MVVHDVCVPGSGPGWFFQQKTDDYKVVCSMNITAYYGADPYAASDHDPIVIGFNPLAGDLNDDGVVDNTDRHLMLDAMGSNATAVDRRMDFDGDGIITMRDFVLWTKTFVAFVRSVASFD